MSYIPFGNDYQGHKCYKSGHQETCDSAAQQHQARMVLRQRRILRRQMLGLMLRTWWDAERKARCGDVGCAQAIYDRLQAALMPEGELAPDEPVRQPA